VNLYFAIALAAALIVTVPFAIAGLVGAPWVPILRPQSKAVFDLAGLKPGQTIIDLGSGDGRLLLAAARHGLNAIGYEINPFMYLISLIVTLRYRRRITIRLADIWNVRLPAADAVYVFMMPRFMNRLERKLATELSPGTPVVSMAFKFPGRRPVAEQNGVLRYDF